MTSSRRLALPILLIAAAAAFASALPAMASTDPCTLSGGSLTGGGGRDVMCGTSGNDVMNGRGGDDELRGKGGNDVLGGSSGKDLLLGGDGGDFLTGGSGGDSLQGQAGNDAISARDGELDFWFCGSGSDSLDLDLVDFAAAAAVFGVPLLNCESVSSGAVNEGPNVAISRRSLRVGDDGRTSVRLRCPASLRQPSRCKGRLKLQLLTRRSLRRKAPRTRYSLRPGKASRIPVRLSRRDRRTLRRRRAKGLVTSVDKGHLGKKTTVKTFKLRARR